jgi:predicted ribosomally synthesized peptide with nif11-like leader
MKPMQELYDIVATDAKLQGQFYRILNEAKGESKEKTGEKLLHFAKDAGYEVSLEEIADFFKTLSEKTEEELSDAELDMVAGGKGQGVGKVIYGAVYSAVSGIVTNLQTVSYCYYQVEDGIKELK